MSTGLKEDLKITGRICTRCNTFKLFKEFYKDTVGKYGVQTRCKICRGELAKLNRINNKEHIKNYRIEYRKRNINTILINEKRFRENNKEVLRIRVRNYKMKNRGKQTALESKRKAKKLQAIPSWADLKKIEEFYIEARFLTKTTGIKYVVDHIIPLQGKEVCGLHVQNNLRVITEIENSSKRNKLLEEFQ